MMFHAFIALFTATAVDAFAPMPKAFVPSHKASSALFANVGIWYSTTTGNTEKIAEYIAEATGISSYNDIADAKPEEIEGADALIVGAPTWHTGSDEQRSGTSWDDWYVQIDRCQVHLCHKQATQPLFSSYCYPWSSGYTTPFQS